MVDTYPVFVALDATALEGGRIYIGAANADPEQSPISVYWDAGLTVLATQPLRTSGGVIVRDGTPADVYAGQSAYSIRVRDRAGAVVWYKATTGGIKADRLTFPIPTGPAGLDSTVPGPADNTYTSYSTLLASNPLRKSARLVGDTDVPAKPNGDYFYVSGQWRPQQALGIGFDYATAASSGYVSDILRKMRGIDITQPPYNANPADIGPAISAASAANPGRYLYIPAGTYDLVTPIVQRLTGTGFLPALRLYGDGLGVTIINSKVVNASSLDVDTALHDASSIAYGFHLSGLTLKYVSGANASGITLRNCYQPLIEDVHVTGFTGSGVRLVTTLGDADANNQPTLRRVRIDTCKVWGLDAPGGSGSGGANESSYLTLENVFIQNCGTDDGGSYVPLSGGMRWKGQILYAVNLAFTLNWNCAFYIPRDGKTGQGVHIINLTLENNRKRGVFVRDIFNFYVDGLQLYQNKQTEAGVVGAYRGTVGVEFEANEGVAQNIDLKQLVVRVSHDYVYDAFVLQGANVDYKSCRIEPAKWFNYDHVVSTPPGNTGQRRYVGWRFPNIRQCGILVATTATQLTFQQNPAASPGHTTPLRLRGPLIDPGEGFTGVASTSGEWVPMDFGNGIIVSNTTQTDEGASPSITSGVGGGPIHNVYLSEVSNVLRIRLSNTPTAIDTVTGYTTKAGDTTALFVGRIEVDASGFKQSAGGYLNAMLLTRGPVGTFGYMWVDGAGKMRISNAQPVSDTDGTIVGTQT